MARTVVEKNIWFDDERNLYYVNLDYGKDKKGKRIRKYSRIKALSLYDIPFLLSKCCQVFVANF